MVDESVKAQLALEKGQRDSDRVCQDVLEQLAHLLNDAFITLDNGKRPCNLEVIGDVCKRDDSWQFLLDVKDPSDSLDHIEVCIRKTGWGMKL